MHRMRQWDASQAILIHRSIAKAMLQISKGRERFNKKQEQMVHIL
jgi:hypothetical protein